MESLFKSKKGKKEILALYDKKLDELKVEAQHESISTTFGQTNIIISGKENAPPILVIHGSNGCAPLAFETYPNLSKSYRVYAIDVLAQPNKSAETRLSMKDTSYGEWINEIIRHYDLTNVSMAGFSFGGLIILKTLEYDESKIKEVFLSAPAYIVNGNPLRALFKVFMPMKKYIRTQNMKYVEKFLAEVFTNRDQFAIDYLSKVFLHFKMDFTQVPTIKTSNANLIKTPIHLFAAKDDIVFPGKKMIKRAKKIFPSINHVELLLDSKHVQSHSQNLKIEKRILNSAKK
jgi:pimeloyl-ACP methyl ester carboxylesterase